MYRWYKEKQDIDMTGVSGGVLMLTDIESLDVNILLICNGKGNNMTSTAQFE